MIVHDYSIDTVLDIKSQHGNYLVKQNVKSIKWKIAPNVRSVSHHIFQCFIEFRDLWIYSIDTRTYDTLETNTINCWKIYVYQTIWKPCFRHRRCNISEVMKIWNVLNTVNYSLFVFGVIHEQKINQERCSHGAFTFTSSI